MYLGDDYGRLQQFMPCPTWALYTVILLLLVFQTGCTNLDAVRDFAAATSQSQAIKLAATELSDSPQRQLLYVLDDSAKPTYEASVMLGNSNAMAVVAAYGIVQNYINTLGALAGDGILASNTVVIGNFTRVLSSQSFIGDTNVLTAYGKIATLISKAIMDYYRQEKLRQMIEDVHDSFPLAVSNLEHIVTVDCVLQLSAETNMLNSYYIDSTQLNSTNTPDWAERLVMDSYNAKMKVLLGKIQDCYQCGVALKKIADGYQLMYSNRNHLGTKEFKSMLKSYQLNISDAYTSIKELR